MVSPQGPVPSSCIPRSQVAAPSMGESETGVPCVGARAAPSAHLAAVPCLRTHCPQLGVLQRPPSASWVLPRPHRPHHPQQPLPRHLSQPHAPGAGAGVTLPREKGPRGSKGEAELLSLHGSPDSCQFHSTAHLWRKLQTAGSAVGQLRGQGRHSMAPRTVVKGLERCSWGSRAGWGALGLLRADGGGQIVLTASDAHVGRWVALASGGSRVGRAGGTHGWAVR